MIGFLLNRKKGAKGLKMSARITMTILVLSLLNLLVSASLYTAFYRQTVRSSTVLNAEQVVRQTAGTLENYTEDVLRDMEQITDNICEDRPKDLNAYLNQLITMRPDIASIQIYHKDGSLMAHGSHKQKLKSNLRTNLSFDLKAYEKELGNRTCYFSQPHVQTLYEMHYPWVISLMAKSELPDQAAPVFIVLDVEFAHIGAHINQAGIGESGYCFVLDENNRLVYHPHQQLLNLDIKKEPLESLVKNKDGAQFIGETLFYTNSLRSVGWKVVGKSFVGDLIAKGQSTFILYLVAIFLFNFLMGILIAALLQRSISQPVHQLAAAMSSFTEHSEPFAFEGKMTTIELNQLTTAFNILTRRIHQLVENVRSESLQLRKTELKALQTQINPHFLYNTLDSIMWMCEQGRGREAVPMIEALASLFRISTSKGHDLIPIRNELKHAEAYLQIQSIRYDHAFSYHFDIDENCLDLLCNKITLQPLLENALYHGIQGMIDEGEMEIIVRDEGDRVALAVADNGIGMTPERAVEILSDEGRETVGIGLNNVHNRILIFFGEGYGLTIESEEDMGTVVTARFPKIKPEEGERYATI